MLTKMCLKTPKTNSKMVEKVCAKNGANWGIPTMQNLRKSGANKGKLSYETNAKTMQKTHAKLAKKAKRKVEKFLDLPFVVLIIIQRLVDLEVGSSLLPNLPLLVQLLVRSLLRTLLQKQELVLLEPS